jgi:hypothetical protein
VRSPYRKLRELKLVFDAMRGQVEGDGTVAEGFACRRAWAPGLNTRTDSLVGVEVFLALLR